ncbi:MAG: DUF4212 domain-containing protein [Bacteroidetes bacterium]|nr:DUF4212 domain-containing protein [Bacteroidota bacterium]
MNSGKSVWKRRKQLISVLLVVWAIVAFGLSIFGAEKLNEIVVAGMPLGFWMAQQGSIFVFVLLILIFALVSDRLDAQLRTGATADDDAKPGAAT